jgi:pSer/pThr/pTyr-binding forkhead associated (FHA) protein
MDQLPLPPESARLLPPEPAYLLRLVLQPAGPTVALTGPEVLIGRHSTAQVRLPMANVSRRHCRLIRLGESWRVEDLGSLNGVYLNGERVLDAPLQNGDVLGIAGLTFDVLLGARVPEGKPTRYGSLVAAPPQIRKAS